MVIRLHIFISQKAVICTRKLMVKSTPYPRMALTTKRTIFNAPAGFSIPVVNIAMSRTGMNLNIRLKNDSPTFSAIILPLKLIGRSNSVDILPSHILPGRK